MTTLPNRRPFWSIMLAAAALVPAARAQAPASQPAPAPEQARAKAVEDLVVATVARPWELWKRKVQGK